MWRKECWIPVNVTENVRLCRFSCLRQADAATTIEKLMQHTALTRCFSGNLLRGEASFGFDESCAMRMMIVCLTMLGDVLDG